MFKFLSMFTKALGSPEPNFTCRKFIADPDAPQTLHFFISRSWDQFEEKLMNLSFIRQYHSLEMLIEHTGFDHFFGLYKKERVESPLIPFIEGHELVRRAYQHRGTAVSSITSNEQFESFGRILARAEEVNLKAAQVYPGNPIVFFNLILGFGGRRMDEETLLILCAKMERASAGFYPGINQVMTFLAPKWGGTRESMFAFARDKASGPERGSFLTTLIANAHIEEWGQLLLEEKKEAAAQYFKRPEVFQSLAEAYQKSQPFTDNVEPWQHARFYNSFGFCLQMMGQSEDVAFVMEKLGTAVTQFPWHFLGESPEQTIYSVRLNAGLNPNPDK
ncbi:hypothetical protein [Cerasicoccus frondis]|uniref:hypothetical protein n=1 Tax=Cerasicoccus frondis TaxID=490090 RepID=UPI0028525D05|nr:hypothetical protein [Cerasicoccus frondis]